MHYACLLATLLIIEPQYNDLVYRVLCKAINMLEQFINHGVGSNCVLGGGGSGDNNMICDILIS